MKRQQAEIRGRAGERIAALWLRLHGWRIVGQRVKTRRGEIDIIAKRRSVLAFVEVKTRNNAAGLATAIDDYRLRRVVAAAEALLPRYGGGVENVRIDVILVRPWRWPLHLKNVWHGL